MAATSFKKLCWVEKCNKNQRHLNWNTFHLIFWLKWNIIISCVSSTLPSSSCELKCQKMEYIFPSIYVYDSSDMLWSLFLNTWPWPHSATYVVSIFLNININMYAASQLTIILPRISSSNSEFFWLGYFINCTFQKVYLDISSFKPTNWLLASGLQRIQKIFFVWGILLDGLYMFPLIPPASNQFGQLNNSRGLLEENIFYSLPFRIFRICLSRFIKLFIQIFVSWDKKKESSLKSSLTRNFWNIVFSFQPVLCINELRPTIKKLTTFHIKRNFILQHSQKIIFVQQ